MKKLTALILMFAMCFILLAGCGDSIGVSREASDERTLAEKQRTSDTLLSDDEISYVMIYNPDIYDEMESYNERRSTGEFGEYVEAVVNRADGMQTPPPSGIIPSSVAENNAGVDVSPFDISGGRGGAMIVPYNVGDTHDFYCGTERRMLRRFICRYAGEYCNVWTYDNSMNDSQVREYGREFDNKIYEETTEIFGKSRFAENGGKVNLLFYPMQEGLGGFFHMLDLWASDEVTPDQKFSYGINTDHDIVNINTRYLSANELIYSTMAHEFQHLINFTNYFSTAKGTQMRTWLNEAMSGYIEEVLYPGAKDTSGHYEAFSTSNRIRHGQSMYNFETTMANLEFDIGVYGSVYLFSEYLANLAGDSVYSKIHSYWRDSYSMSLDEAEAIVNSISDDAYEEIADSVDFEDAVFFDDEDDEWLSKLTFNFYLSLVKPDRNDPDAYRKIEAQTLLYDEINPADIEGGGRVIAALRDGEFKFLEDADEGLVYVGFNKDFEIVTEFVVR